MSGGDRRRRRRLFAFYVVLKKIRQLKERPMGATAREMLSQTMEEAVRNHSKALAVLQRSCAR